jgi:energy-coupling factor transporter ATP-binding protein EcfA2
MPDTKIKNYFPGGNTSQGFYSFYEYLPYKTEREYIIKGGPGTGKSTFMKKIGYQVIDKGYEVEFHWCSFDNNSIDGIVIPDLKIAIYDGTAPHMVDPKYPGALEEIINLGDYWDSNYLRKHRKEIISLTKDISNFFKRTYYFLKLARIVYDEWKSYYLEGMNLDKVNKKIEKLQKEILGNKVISSKGMERHLFGSAITPEGNINYFDNITKDIKNRYIIKGKPGTGKSTLIKKIAEAILQQNNDVLFLHCSFDPESIDAIIIESLNIAILNGTAPHIIDASSKEDKIIDMLECIDPEVITQNTENIKDVKKRFNELMDKAFHYLKKAKFSHDQLEDYYIEAMDFIKVEKKQKEIMKEIMKIEQIGLRP